MRRRTTWLLAAAMLAAPLLALAEYPDKTIKIIVPFAAGGNIDVTARSIAVGMSEALGKPVIVENRPGSAGLQGADYVARATPDGYTLLMASTGSLAAAPALYPKLTFDPVKDFDFGRSVTRVPLILVVNPKLKVKTVGELIALAKARPGTLTMASTGVGSSNHLTGELFQRMSGTKFVHVPYRGSSAALNDLIGGQVDLMFDNIPSSVAFVKAGTLQALGVTSSSRSAALPELTTLAEAGLAGFEASTVTGIALPAKTPKDVEARIDAALAKTLASPKVKENFLQLGADVSNLPPEQYGKLMRDEAGKWTKVIQDADVHME